MSAVVIPFKVNEPEVKCSFCKTPKSKAKSMVKSPINGHAICDKCLGVATDRAASVEVK